MIDRPWRRPARPPRSAAVAADVADTGSAHVLPSDTAPAPENPPRGRQARRAAPVADTPSEG